MLSNFKQEFNLALHRRKEIQPRIESEFRKCLSRYELVSFGVGAIIGSGIFVLTGVAAATKAGPGVVLSYTFAGIVCVFNALAYSELACRVPQTGEVVGWIIGWDLTLEYMIGGAAVARGWSGYVVEFFASFHTSVPWWIYKIPLGGSWHLDPLAVVSIFAFSAFMCFGTKKSSVFTAVLVAFKVVIVIFVIITGSVFADTKNWDNFLPFGTQGVLNGAAVVFFSYVGFDNVCNLAEECKNPKKDLPVGIIGSLVISTLLYILTTIVITLMIPYNQIDINAPISKAFEDLGLQWAVIVVSIGAFVGLTTAEMTTLFAQPRIFYSLASDGLLPEWFAHVNAKYQTPHNSALVTSLICALVAFFVNIEILADMVSIGTLLAFTIVSCCVLSLRYKDKEDKPKESTIWKDVLSFFQRQVEVLCMAVGFLALATSFSVVYSAPLPLIIILLLGTLSMSGLFFFLRTVNVPSSYECPWVPLVPILGIYGNSYMMASLSWESWVRLIAWQVVGMIIYLGYGMWHSKLRLSVRGTIVDEPRQAELESNLGSAKL